jgi:hypothetical protein
MGEAKRRKQVGETEEQKVKRQQKWDYEKQFSNYFRKADRFIRGHYNPLTGETKLK